MYRNSLGLTNRKRTKFHLEHTKLKISSIFSRRHENPNWYPHRCSYWEKYSRLKAWFLRKSSEKIRDVWLRQVFVIWISVWNQCKSSSTSSLSSPAITHTKSRPLVEKIKHEHPGSICLSDRFKRHYWGIWWVLKEICGY